MHHPDYYMDLPGTRDGRRALARLYGKSRVEAMGDRWASLVRGTVEEYGADSVTLVSSPGRTELGGNHTDHNHGRVLCAAVHLDALACAAPSDDMTAVLRSDGYPEPFVVDLSDLEPRRDEAGTTAALIRGVAAALVRRGRKIGGFHASMDSMVPAGSGLSSSAAVEVLLGQLWNALYDDGSIPPAELAMAGREAENVHFGKPCGLMDQMACALGGIVALDFADADRPRAARVRFDFEKEGLAVAIVRTGGSHADLTAEYAAIPAEMKAVAAAFGLPHLRTLTEERLLDRSAELRKAVGDRALLRALHFVAEDGRAADMAAALAAGKVGRFLKLAAASGDSSWRLLQNVIPPGAARHQELALAIELSRRFLGKRGVARVHGGGFAGTIQAFVPADMADDYAGFMDARFGSGATSFVRIRPDGAGEIVA